MPHWFFEDFAEGQSLPPGETTVGADDAAWFAAHVAEGGVEASAWPERGERTGLCVSGWYVAALGMRMICDAFLHRTASLGSPGIETMEWPAPVMIGDRLRFEGRVSTLRASRSRPEMGLVGFEFALINQHGFCVMRQSNVILVQRRT